MRVLRLDAGRPRTTPTALLGDKAHSSKRIRKDLRARSIKAVIPEPRDQQSNRKRRDSEGWRPPAFDAEFHKGRNVVERSSTCSRWS
ncbi:transposase [Nocardia sp. BMG111209]|uniref:transposase n=1 Tax=Nocardia sp. BMG111209 TaxID=1160137 RepID=UPI0009DC410C